MIRAWKAFWGSIAAELDRHAAELRTGVTLIEAVAADKFETELRAVVGAEYADEYRQVALEAAKCGLRPSEAEEAFTQWISHPRRVWFELMQLQKIINERIRQYE